MTMAYALLFILAPEEALPGDGADWGALEEAQRQGIGSGVALRMFRIPSGSEAELEDLVTRGLAHAFGANPFQDQLLDPCAEGATQGSSPQESHLICDAVVPHLEPRTLWLGVYELRGSLVATDSGHPARQMEISSSRCLDHFPLRDAENETCWFYPTENGRYLCWENQRLLQTLPGFLPDQPLQEEPWSYDRRDVHVLWSLMADDQALTCVGLTFCGKRIDWSTTATELEPWATWSSFEVDTMADEVYRESASITVFS